MKFKYYLRGCGLGILLTVAVMSIALHNRGGVMTDEKVIARAGELGMIMPEDDGGSTYGSGSTEDTQDLQNTQDAVNTESVGGTQASTETDVQTGMSEESLEETRVSKVAAALKSDSTDKTYGTEQASETEKVSESIKASETAETAETVTVRIKSGDVCREVAERLEKKGVVEDADQFREYMQKKGFDERIAIGTYQLKKGMTYEEIGNILIGKA